MDVISEASVEDAIVADSKLIVIELGTLDALCVRLVDDAEEDVVDKIFEDSVEETIVAVFELMVESSDVVTVVVTKTDVEIAVSLKLCRG